jgi:hypothetical protein
MGLVTVGVDLGQKRDPTALCVVDGEQRWFGIPPRMRWEENHFVVRYLERLAAGTPFPDVVDRVAEVVHAVGRRTGWRPRVYVDATGLGDPIVDLFRKEAPRVTPVYFNHGDRRTVEGKEKEVTLGKAWLVARLQALLQSGALHLPKTAAAETLARELLDYEISVVEDANERYGAFRVGTQDDLVTALGLAVQNDPAAPHNPRRRLVFG